MIVVKNQLYSFHYSQVPGFKKLYELARQHSYAPISFDERCFCKLAPDEPLGVRRLSLADHPHEEAILQQELQLALKNGRPTQFADAGDRPDVEQSYHRQVLDHVGAPSGDASAPTPREEKLARCQVKHRLGSGYVKLDERKARLTDLTAAVGQFFGARCRCQGDYWYPSGGFRDWHTNKYDAAGWRLYIVDVDAPRQSFFRFMHPQTREIITLWDRPGTFNFFLIDPHRLLWHCIGAGQANRWSKGYVVPDTWLDSVANNIERGAN